MGLSSKMPGFSNPFRPGAGHTPPFLAGRQAEREEFLRLLDQTTVLENMVLTGLRGVGKTVLLDSLKHIATRRGWIWVGSDVSESASLSEDNLAIRLCADLSVVTSNVVVSTEQVRRAGFVTEEESIERTLGYRSLIDVYTETPGLSLDKIKAVLQLAWQALSTIPNVRGVVFAYDEAQNLADRSAKEQFPLSLLMDSFQSLQRKGLPMMLVLTGLPTLFPKLVEARTFSERMFRVVFLNRLSESESEEAIRRPIEDERCPIALDDRSVNRIVEISGGYPYFIQFICREVYDAFIQQHNRGKEALVPVAAIQQKLDVDFFSGRWARATDRQRALLFVISRLRNCESEFTVQEVVEESLRYLDRPFSGSHVNQMLVALASQGLVFKNRHGRYSFSVPLLGEFIRRQMQD